MFGTPSIFILTDFISGFTNFSESLSPAVGFSVKVIVFRHGPSWDIDMFINNAVIWF